MWCSANYQTSVTGQKGLEWQQGCLSPEFQGPKFPGWVIQIVFDVMWMPPGPTDYWATSEKDDPSTVVHCYSTIHIYNIHKLVIKHNLLLKLLLFYSQLQWYQSNHCSTLITDIYLHYWVQGYVMRGSFIFLVPWQMLIFQCGTLSGSHQKLNWAPHGQSSREWVANGSLQTVHSLPLTFRECSVTVNLMQPLILRFVIEIKCIEPVFTIMTRAISNLLTMSKSCYFTCGWHIGWL